MTIAVAAIAALFMFLLRLRFALPVYIVAILLYPPIPAVFGALEFPVARILGLVAILLIVLRMERPLISWNAMDTCVALYFLLQVVAFASASENGVEGILYQIGRGFDTFLPYFVARFLLRSEEDILAALTAVVVVGAIISPFAVLESTTGINVFVFGRQLAEMDQRWGFNRARLTFAHPIYMGVTLSFILGITLGLRSYVRSGSYRTLLSIAAILTGLGAFASMSSGGIISLALVLLFWMYYPLRHTWRDVRKLAIAAIVAIELISNRHFYDVIDRLAFDSRNAWYRNRLFEVAFFEGGMRRRWLTGFGRGDPGWGAFIDGRGHTDLVNQYIFVLVESGLAGFLPFIAIVVILVVYLKRLQRSSANGRERRLLWGLCAGFFGLLVALYSVSLFGQALTQLFIGFGVVSSFLAVRSTAQSSGSRQSTVARGSGATSGFGLAKTERTWLHGQ